MLIGFDDGKEKERGTKRDRQTERNKRKLKSNTTIILIIEECVNNITRKLKMCGIRSSH